MLLPTAYLPPLSYCRACLTADGIEIEQMESFEKQTFRNRCTIRDVKGQTLTLTVPVKKTEHKQFTRDVEISYQSRWQHQHWITLRSAYEHTPYFDYYADYLQPFYQKQIRWLIDLNDGLTYTLLQLLRNLPPSLGESKRQFCYTEYWQNMTWTDRHPWQRETSVVDTLFELGPQTLI